MRSHLIGSLLGFGILGQISTASPLDLRHETVNSVIQPLAARKAGEGRIKCYGATEEKYSLREEIVKFSDKDFCEQAVKQGRPDKGSKSISRKRYTGTQSELSITMEWDPDLDFKPDLDDCKRIIKEITDSCDVGNGRYKGGGEKIAGKVKYQWKPEAERKSWAGCHWNYNLFFNEYIVWGSGWARNRGLELLDDVEALHVSPMDWTFTEEDPRSVREAAQKDCAKPNAKKENCEIDGREWTATFNTVLGTQENIANVIENLVGNGFQVACNAK